MGQNQNTPGLGRSGVCGPVGEGNYTVSQGECVDSIALKCGLFWRTIWDDSRNSDLRKVRCDTNVLLPGDRLFVREIELKSVAGSTERRHRFRRKGLPCKLRVRVLDVDWQPLAGASYVIVIDKVLRKEGELDGEGILDVGIPANSKEGRLVVNSPQCKMEYLLMLGHIDPVDSISGIQGRLNALGFQCGKVDGIYGTLTESAVRAFQCEHKLKIDGIVGSETRKKILELYGR